MNPTDEHDARVVTQITRWTLVMLQNAEQGLISVKALQRTVDPSVLAALGPITPPTRGQPRAKPRVGNVRVHLVTGGLAHVAAVAGRPDGGVAGYVLEFRCEEHKRNWRITEMSRVEERRLVGPDDKHQALSNRDGGRQLPADLHAVIRATEHARDHARHSMDIATDHAQQLRDRLADLKGGSTWKVRERVSLAEQERTARIDAARWQRQLTGITEELRELNDVVELREARRLVETGDPLMAVRKPEHLEQLLGPVPKDRDDRAAWRHAASTIERYRQTWGINDPANALGALPDEATVEQQQQHRTAHRAAELYTETRAPQRDDGQAGVPELELER
jgi:hypothetical protein